MKSHLKQAEASNGMNGWRGLHVGMIPCRRTKKRHARWRWGKKKGTRRARRRLDKEIVSEAVRETHPAGIPMSAYLAMSPEDQWAYDKANGTLDDWE